MLVDMRHIQRVLIVKLSSIGDVVHALPVAVALKRSYPHVELGWAVERTCADMVRGNPFVDEVIEVPRHEWKQRRTDIRTLGEICRFVSNLRSRHYDLVLDLQGLLKSAALCRLSGAPLRYSYHRQREGSRWLVRAVPRRPESVHIVDQYLDVAAALGAQVTPVAFPLAIPDADHETAERLMREIGVSPDDSVILINPSAGRDDKRWSPGNFAQLSDRLDCEPAVKCVFVGGPGDVALGEHIAFLKTAPMRTLIGRTSLKQLAALLQRSALHICGDTGSGHIAAAVGTRCVSIFGPTDPARSGPYGQLATSLWKRESCTKCPPGRCAKRECINWVTTEEVFTMSLSVLPLRTGDDGVRTTPSPRLEERHASA